MCERQQNFSKTSTPQSHSDAKPTYRFTMCDESLVQLRDMIEHTLMENQSHIITHDFRMEGEAQFVELTTTS